MKFRKEPYISQRLNRSGQITFQVRIRTENGDITKSFSEKDYPTAKLAFESAVLFRNKVQYELATNNYQQKDARTVDDMFEYYLEHTTDSYKTKDYHQKLYNKYISHKDTQIQELTRADVQDDLNRMVEIATNDTIGRVFSIWKDDIVGSALFLDIVQKDVTLGIRRPQSHVIKVKRDVTTDRETVLKVEDCILKSVSNHYDAKIIVFLLETLYYTGMRPAEAEVLTRDDISRGYISVTKELGSSMTKMGVVRRCKTPTSVRKIPIHQNLKPILNELLECARYDEVFKKHDGEYMDSTWIGNIIRNVCKANGIEFNMYRLRHNMATSLVTKQVDTKTTMEILGHAHYDMSLYYANSNDSLKNDAVNLLS